MPDASAWIVFVNRWPLLLTHALMSTAFHCAQNSSDANSMSAATVPQKPKSRRSALPRVEDEGEDVATPQPGLLHLALDGPRRTGQVLARSLLSLALLPWAAQALHRRYWP
jgi:hypothetical protein